MALMTFPESLRKDFDVLADRPMSGILPGYHVSDRKPGGREYMLRLLPESFCQDPNLVDKFHEFFARFAAISNKSYTPQVYSVSGAVNGPVYVLEEYVSGISLTEFAKKKVISSDFNREVTDVLSKICEGLHHAHQKDIYHLCITPEDIIVDELTGRVKLVGFGTQIFAQVDKTGLLPEEAKKHVPPEVSHGKAFGPTADIYSLATAINEVCPEVFADTDVLSKALSDNPSEPYQTARDFERALNDVLEDISIRTQSRNIDTPMEARGGLKPVWDKKSVNVEQGPRQAQTPEAHSPFMSVSLKWLAGIAIGLVAVVTGLALYSYHHKQILEKDLQIAQIREADQRAAVEKERNEKEKQEKEAEIAKRKEAQRQADLYKEQLEKERQEKEKLKAEQEKNQREKEEKERLLKQEQERVAKEAREKELAILKEKEEQDRIKRQEQDRQEKEAQLREIERLKAQLDQNQREKEEKERLLKQEQGREAKEAREKELAILKEKEEHERQERQKSQWEQQQREREETERLARELKIEQEWQRGLEEKQNAFLQKLSQLVRSIEKGSEQARQEIGNLCRDNESMNLIRNAAENGNVDAQFILGRAYHLGVGVSTDYNRAVIWYARAANQESAAAECNLGYIYHEGKGVARNRSTASAWFRKAAQHGDTDAARMLRDHYGD